MNRYYYYLNFMDCETEALGNLLPSSKSTLSGYRRSCYNKETQTYKGLNKFLIPELQSDKECNFAPQDHQGSRVLPSSGSAILGVLPLLV